MIVVYDWPEALFPSLSPRRKGVPTGVLQSEEPGTSSGGFSCLSPPKLLYQHNAVLPVRSGPVGYRRELEQGTSPEILATPPSHL